MQDQITKLRDNICSVFFGDQRPVDFAIRTLLARGHLLFEDVPGVGKTLLASAFARSIDCSFGRIQLTPDLLPTDVLGVMIFNQNDAEFTFHPGPIFANLVLADEINRTSPRTQTAMLEAMNEAAITIDGTVHILEQPFMVIATQNPFDFEGTYPLPENQLDRFLIRTTLGYPTAAEESNLLERRPQGELKDLAPVLTREDVLLLQSKTDDVSIHADIRAYIVALAQATRDHADIRVGMSPRGSLALAQACRATAMMDGRDYVTPDDVVENAVPVAAHRIFPNADGSHDLNASIIRAVVETVPSPA